MKLIWLTLIALTGCVTLDPIVPVCPESDYRSDNPEDIEFLRSLENAVNSPPFAPPVEKTKKPSVVRGWEYIGEE